MSKDVAIVMGSDSDWPTMMDAADVLDELGISYNVDVISAHRTPHEMLEFAGGAVGAGYKVIIAGAGGAAHLPGMVAAFILAVILCWNEYFFAALLTSTHAKTLPVMVASQTGSQGISWWSMAAVSSASILPLIIIGIVLERFIVKGLTAGAVK